MQNLDQIFGRKSLDAALFTINAPWISALPTKIPPRPGIVVICNIDEGDSLDKNPLSIEWLFRRQILTDLVYLLRELFLFVLALNIPLI